MKINIFFNRRKNISFPLVPYLSFVFILLVLIPGLQSKSSTIENNIKIDKSYLKKTLDQPYILGAGDLIKIEVSEIFQELNNVYRIDGNGTIKINNLGTLFVGGLTISELEKILAEKYNEIIYDSEIKIDVLEYRSIRLSIQGEVNSSGLITLPGQSDFNIDSEKETQIIKPNLEIPSPKNFPTIYDALRKAGGITLNSDLSNIEIIRKNSISNGGGLIKAKINLFDFINGINNSQNIRVFDDDIILVKKGERIDKETLLKAISTNLNEKYVEVFISGRVYREGLYKLSPASTLNDAVEFAGGSKPISGKVLLARINGDGTVLKKRVRYKKNRKEGTELNPYLREGDIIHVGDNNFNKLTSILTEVTAPIQGLLNTYYLYKIID